MHPNTIELMEEHVRDIYRALTGNELRKDTLSKTSEPALSVNEVTRRFVDLESTARQIPTVGDRVPPFSFSPALDVIGLEDHIVLEFAVPGVDHGDVEVACTGEFITIAGVRSGVRASGGQQILHAEIPRGPFHRVVRVPCAFVAEPHVEVERGLIRVRLPKAQQAASHQTTSETTANTEKPSPTKSSESDSGK